MRPPSHYCVAIEQRLKPVRKSNRLDGGHRRQGSPEPVPISEVKAGAVAGDVRCASA